MTATVSRVILFDGRPEPAAMTTPITYGFPLTVLTGRQGDKGDPGDENVLVLMPGEDTPPDGTPDGTIIYRLLEAP